MAFKLIFIALAILASCHGYPNLSDDVEDPDVLLAHLRVERGDYTIGGVIAKSGKPGPGSSSSSSSSNAAPAPAPQPAPSSQPAPAPAPAAKPAPAAQPAPAAAPSPQPSPAAPDAAKEGGGGGGENKPKAPSEGQAPTKSGNEGGGGGAPVSAAGGGGAVSNGKGGPCPMSVYPSQVLSDIALGGAQLPDYNLKFTDTCKISECSKICQKASCNYFMRSSTNGLSYFYSVKPEKLNSPTLTDSVFYDSFIPQCATGSGSSANGQFLST